MTIDLPPMPARRLDAETQTDSSDDPAEQDAAIAAPLAAARRRMEQT